LSNQSDPEPEINWHTLAWGRIERSLRAGRNPSKDDLLAAIVADMTIPEPVRIYAQRLQVGEVSATRGAKPEWNLNHSAWQRQRDIILIEVFETLRSDLLGDPEWAGLEITSEDVFLEFERREWGAAQAWLGMAGPETGRWDSATAHARYFEAKGRLEAGAY
jgi:hypothetical protein